MIWTWHCFLSPLKKDFKKLQYLRVHYLWNMQKQFCVSYVKIKITRVIDIWSIPYEIPSLWLWHIPRDITVIIVDVAIDVIYLLLHPSRCMSRRLEWRRGNQLKQSILASIFMMGKWLCRWNQSIIQTCFRQHIQQFVMIILLYRL